MRAVLASALIPIIASLGAAQFSSPEEVFGENAAEKIEDMAAVLMKAQQFGPAGLPMAQAADVCVFMPGENDATDGGHDQGYYYAGKWGLIKDHWCYAIEEPQAAMRCVAAMGYAVHELTHCQQSAREDEPPEEIELEEDGTSGGGSDINDAREDYYNAWADVIEVDAYLAQLCALLTGLILEEIGQNTGITVETISEEMRSLNSEITAKKKSANAEIAKAQEHLTGMTPAEVAEFQAARDALQRDIDRLKARLMRLCRKFEVKWLAWVIRWEDV